MMTKSKDCCRTHHLSESVVRRIVAVLLGGAAIAIMVWQGSQLLSNRNAMKELDAARLSQAKRAQLIIRSSPSALIMCGPDGKIVVANAAAEEILGWNPEELIGKCVDVLLPESAVAKHRQKFEKAAAQMAQMPDMYMVRNTGIISEARRKDGTIIKVRVSVRAIKYGNQIEFITGIRPDRRSIPKRQIGPIPEAAIQSTTVHK